MQLEQEELLVALEQLQEQKQELEASKTQLQDELSEKLCSTWSVLNSFCMSQGLVGNFSCRNTERVCAALVVSLDCTSASPQTCVE